MILCQKFPAPPFVRFETCRRLQIPVREYLSAVLPGLEDFPANRVNELTPVASLARKS